MKLNGVSIALKKELIIKNIPGICEIGNNN